jgi:cAMP-dependent protein kinase regulator
MQRDSHSPAAPTRRGPPGNLAFNTPGIQSMHAPAPSPFSETGPTDSPFGGPRRATAPAGGPPSGSGTHSGSNLSGTPLFASPFAAAPIAPPITGVESSPFSGERPVFDNSPFGQMEQHHDEPNVPSYALGRRTSVSAESLVPANQRSMAPSSGLGTTLEEDEDTPNQPSMPVFPKSEAQLQRIKTATQANFLFRSLTEEQEADVLAAMKEVNIGAGEMIIEQGAAGDYFYIVESGELDVFVKREGQVIEEANGDRALLGKKVATCVEGNSFGELALMHKWVHLTSKLDSS